MLIAERFNGPPDSGNGGYSCGSLASHLDAPAVEVSLRAPPPLDRELAVEERDGVTVALDGETVVAEARAVELGLEPPRPVTLEEAVAADARSPYRDVEQHWFDTCFVCGPSRDEGDGLRMFPGPLDGGDNRHAAVFRPDASVADTDGRVLPEIVWAALDCPSSAPIADWDASRPPSVLARLAAEVKGTLSAGEEYIALSWPISEDGRKREAGSALFTTAGEPLALARALWIELRER